MCSILGFHGYDLDEASVSRLNRSLSHRGPDAAGMLRIGDRCILAHNRLSIVGLEAESNQPFVGAGGRYTIVFNGEIYNYVELRAELERAGEVFRTQSDTEVLLTAWARWGHAALDRFNGMFAFAIYDATDDSVVLVRDRLGVKPLYYSISGPRLAFASEIQPLLELHRPYVEDATASDCYFALGYIPAPLSIAAPIRKLEPGTVMHFRNGTARQHRYWEPRYTEIPRSQGEALEELDALLRDAVRIRSRADVPVGAFLSGGCDSSVVTAYMADAGARVKTFTIGFDDPAMNEAEDARYVANVLGTEHHEQIVTKPDLEQLLPAIWAFGEPFADPSAYPTYVVSQFAARDVKVVLSGDGGDEFFMGYDKNLTFKALGLARRIPTPARHLFRYGLQGLSSVCAHMQPRWAAGFASLGNAIGSLDLPFERIDIIKKTRIAAARRAERHQGEAIAERWIEERFVRNKLDEPHRLIDIDVRLALPDYILTKVDRMSMAHGLEVRSPLLDYRIAEFALSLPADLKMPGMRTKHLLKVLGSKYFKPSFLNKPKRGFVPPLDRWIGEYARGVGAKDSREAYTLYCYEQYKRRPCLAS